ncbi:hypothetical protein [Thalassospira xiamenensis]|jgi:hypothetical protein|tara:strand:+ start:1902 stop:2039 length:138 start_codon:yes stop_codon:yes gene_type:complete
MTPYEERTRVAEYQGQKVSELDGRKMQEDRFNHAEKIKKQGPASG